MRFVQRPSPSRRRLQSIIVASIGPTRRMLQHRTDPSSQQHCDWPDSHSTIQLLSTANDISRSWNLWSASAKNLFLNLNSIKVYFRLRFLVLSSASLETKEVFKIKLNEVLSLNLSHSQSRLLNVRPQTFLFIFWVTFRVARNNFILLRAIMKGNARGPREIKLIDSFKDTNKSN